MFFLLLEYYKKNKGKLKENTKKYSLCLPFLSFWLFSDLLDLSWDPFGGILTPQIRKLLFQISISDRWIS